MKFLVLDPFNDAQQGLVEKLKRAGVAVLTPQDPEEAWQMLCNHGTSVDLAIIQREIGGKDLGCQFIERVKADPTQADLPMILTSKLWGDLDFAKHQRGPTGVNAYLKAPCPLDRIIEIVEAVMGVKLENTSVNLEDGPTTFEKVGADHFFKGIHESLGAHINNTRTTPGSIRLEEASGLQIGKGEGFSNPRGSRTIQLEHPHPEMPEEASSEPLVVAPKVIELDSPPPLLMESSQVHENLVGLVSDVKVMADEQPDRGELSYLFQSKNTKTAEQPYSREVAAAAVSFVPPLGEAVIPGGMSANLDVETLKKYLVLREQDVAILSSQLKHARDQIAVMEGLLKEERTQVADLKHSNESLESKVVHYEQSQNELKSLMDQENERLKQESRAKSDRIQSLENQSRISMGEMEKLKERVRNDIRKIRMREKELENRLEIIKKDSEALLTSRENRIIELKRKLDLLEFNMDLLQDQLSREKTSSTKMRDRLDRAAQAVKSVGGMLDKDDSKISEAS